MPVATQRDKPVGLIEITGEFYRLIERSSAMFMAAAVYSYLIRNHEAERAGGAPAGGPWAVAGRAAVVVFVAEWGDLTQILTANLAARYHSPLSVAIGSVLALWSVAALAVASGQGLLRFVKIATIRKVTAVVLVGLGAYTVSAALR